MTHFPIAYFGSVSYLQTLLQQTDVLFEVCDHFPKQTFRNRTTIVSSQGLQILTIPVEKPNGTKTLTKDIRISSQTKWADQHLKAIKTAYASAPFFEHYEMEIKQILDSNDTFLIDKNERLLSFLINTWELPLKIAYTKTYITECENDFREVDFEQLAMKGNYTQVLFSHPTFYPTASVLDLLFCEGPLARKLLF